MDFIDDKVLVQLVVWKQQHVLDWDFWVAYKLNVVLEEKTYQVRAAKVNQL